MYPPDATEQEKQLYSIAFEVSKLKAALEYYTEDNYQSMPRATLWENHGYIIMSLEKALRVAGFED